MATGTGIEASVIGEPPVVALSGVGRIPPEKVSQAEFLIHTLIEHGRRRFVIDFSGMEYVSSEGVGIAVHYHMVLSACGGKLVVVKGPPSVMERIGRFIIPVLRVVDTRAEALALFGVDERSAARAK